MCQIAAIKSNWVWLWQCNIDCVTIITLDSQSTKLPNAREDSKSFKMNRSIGQSRNNQYCLLVTRLFVCNQILAAFVNNYWCVLSKQIQKVIWEKCVLEIHLNNKLIFNYQNIFILTGLRFCFNTSSHKITRTKR